MDPSNEHVVHAEYLTMSENTSYCNSQVVYDVKNPGRLTNMEDWLNEIDCYAGEMWQPSCGQQNSSCLIDSTRYRDCDSDHTHSISCKPQRQP